MAPHSNPRVVELQGVLETAVAEPGWWRHAACIGATAKMFGQSVEAVAVCESCPVQASCLADARDYELDRRSADVAGVRGGLTATQRVAVYRRIRPTPHTRRAECGTSAGYHAHRRRGEEPCRICTEAHAGAHRVHPYPSDQHADSRGQFGDAYTIASRAKAMGL